ncbi:MAG: alpha/beta hydrolase [Steroidobacterales bacterium]
MLPTVEIETATTVDATVIWLHGLGADAHDFEPIVPELLPRRERPWRFVFPDAPIRPVTINGGMRMRAWYDIQSFDRTATEDERGFKDSATDIEALIAREVGRGISAQRIVLAGFSQGGAVSLYLAPRYPERLAGVMALSCYLPLGARLAAERVTANDATPLFMAHGLADAVIPIALAMRSRDLLRKAGYPVEWHEYPMAHSVCPAEIAAIREFLLRVLG